VKRLLILIVPAFLLGGCATPTEADKRLNHQTREAGALVERVAADPVVKQAGSDIRQNSETLAKNLIGQPKDPQPYSPEASVRTREESDRSHEGGWLSALGTFALTLVGFGGLLPIAQRFLPMILGGRAAKAAQVAVEGIARVREAAKASPDGKIDGAAIVSILEASQKDPKVQELLAELAKKVEERLGLKGI
jgi:hypothetical protein